MLFACYIVFSPIEIPKTPRLHSCCQQLRLGIAQDVINFQNLTLSILANYFLCLIIVIELWCFISIDVLQIPADIMAALEPIKDNEEAVRAYGIHLGTEMCKKILAHGIKTLHLYTLNMEKSALAILMVLS